MTAGLEDDITALAAVAAVRAASGDVFLPAEADASPAAVAGLDKDLDLVNEFHGQ